MGNFYGDPTVVTDNGFYQIEEAEDPKNTKLTLFKWETSFIPSDSVEMNPDELKELIKKLFARYDEIGKL
jgi:hypothetical protein